MIHTSPGAPFVPNSNPAGAILAVDVVDRAEGRNSGRNPILIHLVQGHLNGPGIALVVLVLWNPEDSVSVLSWKEIQGSAQTLRIEVQSLEVRNHSELDGALDRAARAR